MIDFFWTSCINIEHQSIKQIFKKKRSTQKNTYYEWLVHMFSSQANLV